MPKPTHGKSGIEASSFAQSETKLSLWIIETLQPLGLVSLKMSLIFFFRRIFGPGLGKTFKWFTMALITLSFVWGVSYFFTWVFYCPGHTNAYWTTLADEKKYCVNTTKVHQSFSITDVIVDVIIFMLPVPLVLKLQMPMTKKVAVLAVFGVGAL